MEITREKALEAKKILKEYERQKKAEARAKRCALPCSALVHDYLKRKNDGYGFDAWDADAQKLYRAVKAAEQSALNWRRRKGFAEASKIRRLRWTPAMKNALQNNDTAFLRACGLSDGAINAMRWKVAHEASKEDA
jgi:hypothetical protein